MFTNSLNCFNTHSAVVCSNAVVEQYYHTSPRHTTLRFVIDHSTCLRLLLVF